MSLVRGPFEVKSRRSGADGVVECFVGDSFTISAQLVTRKCVPVTLSGDSAVTLSAWFTSPPGTLLGTAWCTIDNAATGHFSFVLPGSVTLEARHVQATFKRTEGSDVQTFGPLPVLIHKR